MIVICHADYYEEEGLASYEGGEDEVSPEVRGGPFTFRVTVLTWRQSDVCQRESPPSLQGFAHNASLYMQMMSVISANGVLSIGFLLVQMM